MLETRQSRLDVAGFEDPGAISARTSDHLADPDDSEQAGRTRRGPLTDQDALASAQDTAASADEIGSSATVDAGKRAVIKGHADGLDKSGRITGWAYLPSDPARRVNITVFAEGRAVASGLADQLRADVKDAGHGDGNCGYSIPVPRALLDGRPHRLSIACEVAGAETLITPMSFRLGAAAELEATLGVRRKTVGESGGSSASGAEQIAIPPLPAAAGGTGAGAIYVPGHLVRCGKPHPLPAYHTRGWHQPEPEFTWIDGIEGVIELLVRRPSATCALHLHVFPNLVAAKPQTLEIFFNYFRLGRFEIPRPMSLCVELPAELFILHKTQLNLHCPDAVRPSDFGSPDTRRLGIAVASWRIG